MSEQRSIHKVGAYRVLSADSMEHLLELTVFLVNQGWNEYGGVRIMVNPDNPGGDKLYLQPMVVYDEEKLE